MNKKLAVTLIILIILVLSPLIALLYWGMGPVYKHHDRITSEIQKNQTGYQNIFTNVFDNAKKCSDLVCKIEIQEALMQNLHLSDLNIPVYFVRKNGDKFEKLFMSGEVKVSEPENGNQKQIFKLLEGKRTNLYWDKFRISEQESSAIFFKDLYSEAEVIVPVAVNNQILGVVVYLYGD